MTEEYKPTRSTLIEIKKKIKLSQTGHNLLKMKRDGLIMEFFNILEKSKDIRSRITANYKVAMDKLAIAKAVDGAIEVKSAAFALSENPTLELKSRNVMGIVVPEIEAKSVRKKLNERGYGIIGTSNRIDEAAKAYEELVEAVVQVAEKETVMKKLLDEIEGTRRRVNALEFRVLPELKQVEGAITMRLEELERENVFRLKRFKGWKA